jgi:tripartite-type tricarboxylate transporter receptor subunit TctC
MSACKTILVCGFAISAHLFAGAQANAQVYPSKPIRIVVPFIAGGAIDALARIVGAKMQESMNVAIIVENRPGAGGNVGTEVVAKSAPDGYTILLNSNGQAISPATFKSLSWDPVRDFIPVTQLVATNLVLVASNETPARNLQEFLALAKAKPGVLNYASTGIGNPLHLTMELLKLRAGVEIQMVSFRSDGEIINALMGNFVQAAIVPIATGKAQIEQGTVRGIAVTGAQRAKGLDLATVGEQGVADFAIGGWQGFFVAAKTPPAIVDRIYRETRKALDMPDVQQRLDSFANVPVGSTPEEFEKFYVSELASFKALVAAAKIPLQE